jgi:hypothetical protein
MIAVPIPDYQTLMLPVLRLAAKGETRVPDVEQQLARDLQLDRSGRTDLEALRRLPRRTAGLNGTHDPATQVLRQGCRHGEPRCSHPLILESDLLNPCNSKML